MTEAPLAPDAPAPPAKAPPEWSHKALLAPSARYLALLFMVVSPFFPVHGLGVDLCLLHATTGLPCPGCGMTRAISAFSQGDFSAALGLNPFVLFAWPTFLVLAVTTLLPRGTYLRFEAWVERRSSAIGRVYKLAFVAFLVFGLIRLGVFAVVPERFP